MTPSDDVIDRCGWSLQDGSVVLGEIGVLETAVNPAYAPRDRAAFSAWIETMTRQAGHRAVAMGDLARTDAKLGIVIKNVASEDRLYIRIKSDKSNVYLLSRELQLTPVPARAWKIFLASETSSAIELLARQSPLKAHTRRLLGDMARPRQGAIGWSFYRDALPADNARPVVAKVVGLGLSLLLSHGLETLAWILMVRVTLTGQSDLGWLIGWALLILTHAPVQCFSDWLKSTIVIELSAGLRARMITRSLEARPNERTNPGLGEAVGNVFETQALDSFLINGGLSVGVGVLQALIAIPLLAAGVACELHVVLFVAWMALIALLSQRLFNRLADWTKTRKRLVSRNFEQLNGLSTWTVQSQTPGNHDQLDQDYQNYLEASVQMDKGTEPLVTWVVSGWLIAALLALLPAFWSGETASARIALSIGGILTGQRALSALAGGATALGRAWLTWSDLKAIFVDTTARMTKFKRPTATSGESTVAQLIGVSTPFCVRSHIDLRICQGDRLILKGRTGAGKSQLLAILAGLHEPKDGVVLAEATDAIAYVPDFHNNHIFTGTLHFNLYLGSEIATLSSPDVAEKVCRYLGLGGLLDRMPFGLSQPVGEGGWLLSQGEKCRIFIARALLRSSNLTLLDDCLSALDPENKALSLQTIDRMSRAAVVVA